MQKGFTLLELLVVIAIIGILSSIVLVSYNGYAAKARLAKTLSWAGSINHSLGDQAVGAWTFDNISGATVYDDSGNNNNGTAYGGPAVVDGVIGKALQFNGASNYVSIGNNLGLENTSFTISVWIKPSSNINTGSRFSVAAVYSPGWLLDLPDDSDQEGYRFFNGTIAYKYVPSSGLIDLQWTHWTVVVDKPTNNLRMYINGILKQSWTISAIVPSANPLSIGRRTDGYYFNGLIDDVRIFSAALSQAQIQQYYADGLKTHQNLAVR